MKKLSIIIPCFNEEATIAELLRRVELADVGDWGKEIIVVDDGSRDATREILDMYRKKPQYTIIFHEKNKGKGGVERTAIAAATGDYIIIQDADLEYNPAEIKKLTDYVDKTGAQVVFGSRNMETAWGRARSGFFFISIGVWFSTKVVNLLYGLHLTDAWTCYKLFSKEVSEKAKFIGSGFEADYIFIGEVAVAGYAIDEVPISHAPRTVEEGKKIRYGDGLKSLRLILMHRLVHLVPENKRQNKKSKIRKEKIRSYLVCPECKKPLLEEKVGFVCKEHGSYLKSESGSPILINEMVFLNHEEEHLSGVNWLKTFLKQFPSLYYGIWNIFCPVLMMQNGPKKIIPLLSKKEGVILDVGSGPERLGDEFINVDVFPFPEVDVVANASALPFQNDSVIGIVSESLLEHVSDPQSVASEMVRVLKPGGLLYVSAPFIHPYHASPDDFNRWTVSGLKFLFSDLEVIEQGVRSGPWSAFLMFLAYWLGVIFSFGSRKTAPFLAHIFMLVLGPLKYLDLIFANIPGAEAVSAHLYIIGRKK